MALNAFRGDAALRPKVIQLLKPNNLDGISARILVNNKSLLFEDWNAADIVAAINDSDLAEFDGITASIAGGNVQLTGEDDVDFEVSQTQVPTAVVTNAAGVNPRNQATLINFGGASGGTFTITINGETTAAITFGDLNDGRTKITALPSVGPSDFDLVAQGADWLLTMKGAFAATAVTISVNGGGLTNVVGSVVRTQVSKAVLARYDVYQLSFSTGSMSANVTIDGNTARIFSDDSIASVRSKLQALTTGGRVVNVYGGPISSPMGAPYWIIEFEGYSTAVRPTVSVGSVIGGGTTTLHLLYDATAGISMTYALGAGSERRNELVMFDFSEGSPTKVQMITDGVAVEITSSMTPVQIADALNSASRYSEWLALDETVGGHPNSTKVHLFQWYRNDLYNDDDVPETYVRQTGGDGRFKVLANGGTAVSGSVVEVYRTPTSISGGTFTLTFVEGTTGAIAWNASAATVQAAVAAVVTGSTCSTGTGSPSSPWRIQIGSTSTSPNQIPTAASSFTGQGSSTSTTSVTAFAGTSASAKVKVSTRAASGFFLMRYGAEGPVAFNAGLSAAAFKSQLQLFPSLASSGDTTVAFDSPSGEYAIAFTGNLALREVLEFSINPEEVQLAIAGSDSGAIVLQTASGPSCFADPENWTLRRFPQFGDDVVVDSASADIEHGLRHFVTITADVSTNRFTSDVGHDFRPNQKIRFFGTTLPAPLLGGVDYYVVQADYTNGSFAVASTVNGAPIDITSAGVGEICAGVMVRSFRSLATMTKAIGLAENNAGGYREHRNRYLRLGVSESVDIGEGNGGGSPMLRIDFGNSVPVVRVVATGTSSESGFPAFNMLAKSEELRFGVMEGSAGIACGDDESSIVADIGVHGGEVQLGTVTVRRDVIRNSGTITSRELIVEGVLRMN